MRKSRKRKYDEPLRHPGHTRPRTRREFLAQGFIMGSAAVIGGATVTLPGQVQAQLAPDLLPFVSGCGIATQGAGQTRPVTKFWEIMVLFFHQIDNFCLP